MAKKVGTTRVHQIAKELGVTSKDIVKKCDDEGIPSVTNHMSTLSAGLAATIREWFASSESNVATAVQTAALEELEALGVVLAQQLDLLNVPEKENEPMSSACDRTRRKCNKMSGILNVRRRAA